MKQSKLFSTITVTLIYIVTIILSILLFKILPFDNSTGENILIKIAICDLSATLFIFIFSMIFDNSSVYDPYWSIAPVVMVIGFMIATNNFNIYNIILIILIVIWSIRLTLNCAINFKNLNTQDWRYQKYKESSPKWYWVISFFGFHLVPTLVVFIALLPVFFFINSVGLTNDTLPTAMTILSYILMLASIVIETIADIQMSNFIKTNTIKGKVMNTGLWKVSRHPNYFGEVAFWFTLFLCYFSLPNALLILIFSPIVVFLLFEFISIPLMEKRQLANKPAYKDYMLETNAMFIVFPPKK